MLMETSFLFYFFPFIFLESFAFIDFILSRFQKFLFLVKEIILRIPANPTSLSHLYPSLSYFTEYFATMV